MLEDLNVRPIAIDKLVQFQPGALASRLAQVETHLQEYAARCATLRDELSNSERVCEFLEKERDAVILAQKLQEGNIVRVVCPQCQGSGMKPHDMTSGQLSRKTAFESVGSSSPVPTEIDPADQCASCQGHKWILMDRYRG